MVVQSTAAKLQDNPPLVSTPATTHPLSVEAPYLSPLPRSSNVATDEGPRPSLEQATAISDLKAFDDLSILAWLTLLRSIDPSIHLRASHPAPGCLTSQQLRALVTLRGCHNDHISAWLDPTLLSGNGSQQRGYYASKRPNAKRAAASSPRHTRQNSAKSSNRSSISSIGQFSTNNNFTSRSTPRSSLGSGSLLFDLPEGAPEDEESTHVHYCTHSKHEKAIDTCDGWKRHEREHEVVYRCMPSGAVEDTGSGPECAFCGIRDPAQSHLLKHNAIPCPGAGRKPLTLSRRSNLVQHLTLHNIYGDEASALADKWRYDSGKKAFSCGFCIKSFATLSDRSNHIDNEHWKYGQDMSGWSLTNVIRGLLLQPELREIWQHRMASNSSLHESSFRWELPQAEGLQSKLELSEDSPMDLEDLAYRLSNHGSEPVSRGLAAIAAIPRVPPVFHGASSFDGCHSMGSARMPVISPTQNAAPEMRQRRNLIKRDQPSPLWSDNNTFMFDSTDWWLNPPYQQSASHKDSTAVNQSWDGVSNEIVSFSNGNDYTEQWCSSLDVPSTTSTSSNQVLPSNYNLYHQGFAIPNDGPLDAQLLSSTHESADTFSSPERQRQQYNSWSTYPDSRDNRAMPASSINDSGYTTSNAASSCQRSSEKPLPPLPDDNKASSPFETGVGSFMELDS